MKKINLLGIKDNLYLLIPIVSIGLWAIFNLMHNIITINRIFLPHNDFTDYYKAAKAFTANPADLYDMDIMYPHLPVLAVVMSMTICLFPILIATCIWYICIYILGVLFTIEYNRILALMGVQAKLIRFSFLIIISSGWFIYSQFYQTTFKYAVGIIFLYIIRKEIQYRIEEKEKDLKFYFLNYNLLWFAVAIYPPALFILLLYLFYDIRPINIFKRENIKIYIIVISVFAFQNFYFFINPPAIIAFLNLYTTWDKYRDYFPLFYLSEWVYLNDYTLIYWASTLFISAITLILIFNNNLKLEEKFAYLSFCSIIFSTYGDRVLIVLFPLALLIYVPFLNQNENIIDLLKENRLISIGLLSVIIIYHMPPHFTIFKYFPIMKEYPFIIFIFLRWIFLLSVFIASIIILNLRKFVYNQNMI